MTTINSKASSSVPKWPLTVLRVKRKRDQEPLEALVIHQQKRRAQSNARSDNSNEKEDPENITADSDKTANGLNDQPLLFTLGETVTEAEFDDPKKRMALQDRLSAMTKQRSEPNDNSNKGGKQSFDHKSLDHNNKQAKFRVLSQRQIRFSEDIAPAVDKNNNYGIPRVVSTSVLNAREKEIQLFDAINEDNIMPIRPCQVKDPYASFALESSNKDETVNVEDDFMENFLPMVRNYLNIGEARPEYVYDLYYIGQDGTSVDPAVLHASNIGSVLWINDEDGLIDEADSDEEYGEEDEDSNAEDYYTNEYPDEPDINSEVEDFYYSSDEREWIHSEDQDNQYDNYF